MKWDFFFLRERQLNFSFISPFLTCPNLALGRLAQNVATKQTLKNGKEAGTNLELEVKGRVVGECYACS